MFEEVYIIYIKNERFEKLPQMLDVREDVYF